MKRAYLIEMTIFRDYFKQLMGVGCFVAVFVSMGMGTIVAAPAILTMMFFMLGTMAAATYDEQNNWGLYRLTLPVGRRDVVLARYGVIVTLGLAGMLLMSAICAVVMAVATAVELPMGISEILAFDPDMVQGMVFAVAFCMALGALIASIETPIYFRFGQNKTTQWIPMVTILLFVGPMLIVNGTGILDSGVIPMETIAQVLGFIETPAGVAACFGIALAVAAVALGVSAAVSLKLYERREL